MFLLFLGLRTHSQGRVGGEQGGRGNASIIRLQNLDCVSLGVEHGVGDLDENPQVRGVVS